MSLEGAAEADDAAARVRRLFEAGETMIDRVGGIGATLFVTSRRVIIVRDGARFRPKSGIRWWSYTEIEQVDISRVGHSSARIVVKTGYYPWQAVSMFVAAPLTSDAEVAVGEIRRRSRALRRSP